MGVDGCGERATDMVHDGVGWKGTVQVIPPSRPSIQSSLECARWPCRHLPEAQWHRGTEATRHHVQGAVPRVNRQRGCVWSTMGTPCPENLNLVASKIESRPTSVCSIELRCRTFAIDELEQLLASIVFEVVTRNSVVPGSELSISPGRDLRSSSDKIREDRAHILAPYKPRRLLNTSWRMPTRVRRLSGRE